jgi:hypothetical protein
MTAGTLSAAPRLPRAMTAWLVLAATFIAGCGGPDGLVRVTGTVTMDGAPLEGAVVMFHPLPGVKGNGGIATTDAAGTFTLRSPQAKQGIFPGDYSLTVSHRKPTAEQEQQINEAKAGGRPQMILVHDMPELLPQVYTRPATSPLRASVGPTGADVPVELVSSQKSAKPGK